MVVRPVSAGYYHRYRRGIAIPLANTDTDTNTKVLLIRIMPQVLCTTLVTACQLREAVKWEG